MLFKNKFTGIIEEPTKRLEEQYLKRPEIWAPVKAHKKDDNAQGANYKELKDLATELGLEYPSNIKKEALLELIAQHQAEEAPEE